MYDRLITSGRFTDQPVTPHGGAIVSPVHVYGEARRRHQR